MLQNTDRLRQEALHFQEHGYYTNALPGTKDYYDYWDESYLKEVLEDDFSEVIE